MQVYSELYEFNERLMLNLKFNREPVEKVANNFKFVPDILRGKQILSGDDGRAIAEYAQSIGKSDAVSQIDYLSGRAVWLSKLKDESVTDYKRYSSLYIKIFFMVGVLMAVLLA